MNDTAELRLTPTSTGTELSVIDHARLALASSNAEVALTDLAKRYLDLLSIESKADYHLVMGALADFRRHRVSIKRTGKMARDDANKFAKAVIAEEKRLIGIIEPEETRLTAVRRVWEDEQERIRKEAEEKEEARKEVLRERCLSFERLVALVAGRPSSEIQEVVDHLTATIITSAEFQDFARQAEGSLVTAKDKAARLLAETLERERQAEEARLYAEIEAERRRIEAAELARQREENERAAAELRAQQKAIMEEQRAEAARLEQERAELAIQQEKEATKARQERVEIERQRQEVAAEIARLNAEIERHRQETEAAEAEKAAAIQPAPPAPAAEPQPTLAEELEGWRIRFKVSQKAHEALLTILAKHVTCPPIGEDEETIPF